MPAVGGCWLFEGDAGKWHAIDIDVSAKLSASKMAGESSYEFQVAGNRYKIDFGRKVQINVKTGKERAIKEP